MHLDEFLLGAFVYLTAAVIAAPIAMRLGLGSVLGYLIAGIIIGPSVLGFIGSDGASVMHFAEFGVIMMLFLVGLELQPSKLWNLRRSIIGLGGLQVSLCASAIGIVCYLFGLEWRAALACGLILALSSTAIVLQSMQERGMMATTVGRSTFSVLLFQDISLIPMLALLPLLATQAVSTDANDSLIAQYPAWVQTVAVLGAVGGIILAGRYLMRPLFRIVAGAKIREIFVAFALVIVVGITLLMQMVGLSAALGTFLAGVVLAESEYRHELEMDLEPFKGLSLAVFFMAVGSEIDFKLLVAKPLMIFGLVGGYIAIKFLVIVILGKALGKDWAKTLRFATLLAQGGEFAFVLISFVTGLGLINLEQAALLVAVVALSMAIAPLLMIADDKLVQPLFVRAGAIREADVIDETGAKVIIAGYGRFGMTVGRLLGVNGIKSVVLEHDTEQIDALRKFGFKLFYGDASRLDLLQAAGAAQAEAIVIALKDHEKVGLIIETVRKNFPNLKIFVRATDRIHAYALLNSGIENFYREMFDSSVRMGEDIMVTLGKHPYEAHRAGKLFTRLDDEYLKVSAKHQGDETKLIDIARAGRAEISKVLAGDRGGAVATSNDPAWRAPERDGQ